jgi:rhodanese-related sulfurtransferase
VKILFSLSSLPAKILVIQSEVSKNHGRSRARKILLGSLFLVFVSGLPALVQMAFDGWKPPIAIPFGITVDGLRKELAPIVWIDARPEDAFQAGHIPGALDLNRDNWEAALPHLFELYSPGKIVIVYCSTGCTASQEIADRIRNLGFEQVKVLEGGFEAWQKDNSAK